jgi:hypothetical protein
MGNLHEHAGTIAGFIVRAFGAPVLHPFKNFKAPFQDVMGSSALNIGDKTYAA